MKDILYSRVYDDTQSRLISWVRYRGAVESGLWCHCKYHKRVQILLQAMNLDFYQEKGLVYFTLPSADYNLDVIQSEYVFINRICEA